MAVQAFKFYNKAKKNISGTIALGSTTFFAHLCTSASNFATATISTLASLTNQVASGNGYKLSGKAMTTTWSQGASAGQQKFNFTAFVWTALGGTIPNIKGLVIVAVTGTSAKAGANKLLNFCSLSAGQFTLSQNNTLTITANASGEFTLA